MGSSRGETRDNPVSWEHWGQGQKQPQLAGSAIHEFISAWESYSIPPCPPKNASGCKESTFGKVWEGRERQRGGEW